MSQLTLMGVGPTGSALGWTPQDVNGIGLWVPGAFTNVLYKESEVETERNVYNHATTDGDSVGTVYSPVNGHIVNALSDSSRPTLSTGVTSSMISFVAGSGTNLFVTNSKQCFDYLYTSFIFTVAVRVFLPAGTDGVHHTILDNLQGTGANVGFALSRTAANKLQVHVGNGGSNVILVSTAANFVADGAEHTIVVKGNGVGVGALSVQVDNNTPELFTTAATGTAVGTLSTFDMSIGRRASGSTGSATFKIADLIIVNNVMSAADILLWKNFNKSRTSQSLLKVPLISGQVTAASPSNLWAYWDFSLITDPEDSKTLQFTDTGMTTPVSADGNNINAVRSRKLPFKVRRNLILDGSASSSPIYKVGIQNGKSVAQFNGSNNGTISTYQAWNLFQKMPAGEKHIFYVFKNNSVGNFGQTGQSGSHLGARTAGHYIVQCGSDYSSPTSANSILAHLASGTATDNTFDAVNGGEGVNITEFISNANTFQMKSCGLAGSPITSSSFLAINNIGRNSHDTYPDPNGYWEMNGNLMAVVIYIGVLPASVAAAVRADLAAYWAVPNVI